MENYPTLNDRHKRLLFEALTDFQRKIVKHKLMIVPNGFVANDALASLESSENSLQEIKHAFFPQDQIESFTKSLSNPKQVNFSLSDVRF